MEQRTLKLMALGSSCVIAAAALILAARTGESWMTHGSNAGEPARRSAELTLLMAASGAAGRLNTAQAQGAMSFDRYVENKINDLPIYSGQEEIRRRALIRQYRDQQLKLRRQITEDTASDRLKSELAAQFDSRDITDIVTFLKSRAGQKMAKNMELFTVRPTSLVQQYEYQLAPKSYEASDRLAEEVKMLKPVETGKPNVGS